MDNVVQLCFGSSVWLQIMFCSCVNETTLLSFLRSLLRENGRSLRFPNIFIKKQTWWSNDKTIIELGHRKISCFISVSQINYLPKPKAEANDWFARHWQITRFCSTSSNNCSLFNGWIHGRASWSSESCMCCLCSNWLPEPTILAWDQTPQWGIKRVEEE